MYTYQRLVKAKLEIKNELNDLMVQQYIAYNPDDVMTFAENVLHMKPLKTWQVMNITISRSYTSDFEHAYSSVDMLTGEPLFDSPIHATGSGHAIPRLQS